MNRPVGVVVGGWTTKTWAASSMGSSGSRMVARAWATVAVERRMSGSGVMSPPTVSSP